MDILTRIDKETRHAIPGDRLCELPEWDEDRGRKLARAEGVALTPDHWEVIHFLREHYDREGNVCTGTAMLRALEERFEQQGGGKWLYTLFPGGPVRQASKIAGLPERPFSTDRSFGSVS